MPQAFRLPSLHIAPKVTLRYIMGRKKACSSFAKDTRKLEHNAVKLKIDEGRMGSRIKEFLLRASFTLDVAL